MNRRTFLASTVAISLAAFAPQAQAGETIEYSPGVIKSALADGKTVLVDYAAKWCSTCKRQARVIDALRAENPDYDASMVFVKVDWDEFKNHDVTIMNNVPRRSTLLVLRGDDELGRLIAGTSESEIRKLLDLGVKGSS